MEPRFDPDAAARPGSGIFGLSCPSTEASIHVIAAPYDATSSYGSGSARGPEAILRASRQVELHDPVTEDPWRHGLCYIADDGTIAGYNEEARPLAREVFDSGGAGRVLEQGVVSVIATKITLWAKRGSVPPRQPAKSGAVQGV